MADRKINILWLHPHFLNWMGGHRYIYEVSRRLVKKYNMNVVLYSGAISDYAKNEFLNAGIKIKTFLGLSTNSPFYWLLMPLFLNIEKYYLRQEAKNYSVLISSMFPMNALANSLSKKTIQLCYEPFAFFHDRNFIAGLPFFKKIFVKFSEPFYARWDIGQTIRSKKVLTISKFNKYWLESIYKRKDIKVVYEGVDTIFFKRIKTNPLKDKYRGRQIIFHSTDFTGIKGTQYLIYALQHIIKKFPKLLLLISYTIDNKRERRRMELLAKKLRVEKNIKYLGVVKLKDLPLYYGLAEVVVQPSIKQSMSMSVKEAMACERPTVTCLEGKEQYKDGEAGFLVDPKNEMQLANKVIKLLGNSHLRRDFGKKGKEIVEKKFSWESVADKFYKNIEEIVNE